MCFDNFVYLYRLDDDDNDVEPTLLEDTLSRSIGFLVLAIFVERFSDFS